MKDLVEGDRVILTDTFYGDSLNNPVWEGKYGNIMGTVTRRGGDTVRVLWDNGAENGYSIGLEYIGMHGPKPKNSRPDPNSAFLRRKRHA